MLGFQLVDQRRRIRITRSRHLEQISILFGVMAALRIFDDVLEHGAQQLKTRFRTFLQFVHDVLKAVKHGGYCRVFFPDDSNRDRLHTSRLRRIPSSVTFSLPR
ncbi:MAG: hypothetical protein A2W18_08360 [Candidatus Muproteobacteria bacterium RBG_16_60_9]|uniref:Transposase DDE domain-containing protein n=1 Tax=Candidatus Muproteobacteria bacterium RBG_16_60_9 TaxID=1817755 RepID=A0A1F6UWT1_9PROT|nr:MAG: hypothetical protein A2W18_08360 [Candidatus Muproteobacteria bacterium RBG_16_60_9]